MNIYEIITRIPTLKRIKLWSTIFDFLDLIEKIKTPQKEKYFPKLNKNKDN
jgi:hypothetical protein